MSTFQPGEDLNNIGPKLMENLSEQLLPLFDMTDAETNRLYWSVVLMFGMSIQAQLQALTRFDGIKFAASPPIAPK